MLVTDLFERGPDTSAHGLGIADTGQVWSNDYGSAFLDGHAARKNDFAVIEGFDTVDGTTGWMRFRVEWGPGSRGAGGWAMVSRYDPFTGQAGFTLGVGVDEGNPSTGDNRVNFGTAGSSALLDVQVPGVQGSLVEARWTGSNGGWDIQVLIDNVVIATMSDTVDLEGYGYWWGIKGGHNIQNSSQRIMEIGFSSEPESSGGTRAIRTQQRTSGMYPNRAKQGASTYTSHGPAV